HPHFEIRVDASDLGEKGGEDVQTDRHPTDQADRPAPRPGRVADGGHGVLHVSKDSMTQLEQRFPSVCDPDAPADSMKNGLAELVLEDEDLAADRGLRNVQLFSGGRERAGLGDGPDDFELPEVHASAYMRICHESTPEHSPT